MQVTRIRRSLLYVPGSDAHKCQKALATAGDGVIFDLEDAVSPDKKNSARETVAQILREAERGKKELVVRVNQISTRLGIDDLLAIIPCRPDTLIIPKACPRDITTADVVASGLEEACGIPPGSIGFIPLLETAVGLESLREILGTAERICGLQLGAEDLTKELGIVRTREGNEIAYARSRMIMAARAFAIDAIDTPFADYHDTEGLLADLSYIKSVGMTAKTAIHPAQLDFINAAFTPTKEEVEQAKAIVAAYKESVAKGLGACSLNGKMIDVPIAERAMKVVRKAELINT
ncbi:citrate lyase [Deltaproteobacteria bacterium]|nr:citrate lyase [Deltaproteobacteria bacterium]